MGEKYTLVQHSAAARNGDIQFYRAVEECRVSTARQEQAILKRGGLIFNGYAEAHDRAQKENYPPECKGLIPEANGLFVKYKVEGSHLYVPLKA